MSDAPTKPILFLDFDQTLFDTEQLRAWLGNDIEARIQAIEQGELELPDMTAMLYDDTLFFLNAARTSYRPVLLTTAFQKSLNISPFNFQKKK
ncbi:MAG: hypothetical protein AAB869_02685, partial [Patescibacteria group bacterium]